MCRLSATLDALDAPRLGTWMVCTPDFQGHLIYLAVVAYLGDAQPRFPTHSPPMKLALPLAGQLPGNGPVVWKVGSVFHCPC
jgi:hypothetical protein